MKFGEIFWGEVKIDALKGGGGNLLFLGGGGCKPKGNNIILFSHCQIVKATNVVRNEK